MVTWPTAANEPMIDFAYHARAGGLAGSALRDRERHGPRDRGPAGGAGRRRGASEGTRAWFLELLYFFWYTGLVFLFAGRGSNIVTKASVAPSVGPWTRLTTLELSRACLVERRYCHGALKRSAQRTRASTSSIAGAGLERSKGWTSTYGLLGKRVVAAWRPARPTLSACVHSVRTTSTRLSLDENQMPLRPAPPHPHPPLAPRPLPCLSWLVCGAPENHDQRRMQRGKKNRTGVRRCPGRVPLAAGRHPRLVRRPRRGGLQEPTPGAAFLRRRWRRRRRRGEGRDRVGLVWRNSAGGGRGRRRCWAVRHHPATEERGDARGGVPSGRDLGQALVCAPGGWRWRWRWQGLG